MKHALHVIAIHFGWYKEITTGLPLNVCKTVFGNYFLEGVYTPETVAKLIEDMYRWGCHDGLTSVIPERPFKTEWRVTKDGTRRYRKIARKVVVNRWVTESQLIKKEIPYKAVTMIDWSTLEKEFEKANA